MRTQTKSRHERDMQCKAKQGHVRQHARQGTAMQGEAQQGTARQGKSRQASIMTRSLGKAKQQNGRHDKGIQVKARPGHARQGEDRTCKARCKIRCGKARQFKAGHTKAKQSQGTHHDAIVSKQHDMRQNQNGHHQVLQFVNTHLPALHFRFVLQGVW